MKKTTTKEELVALARNGKRSWNMWARENPGMPVDFSGYDFSDGPNDFAEFVFPGDVNFESATFHNANFSRTEFRGENTNFDYAIFKHVNADFLGTIFCGGSVSFRSAVFSSRLTNFSRAKFSKGSADFVEASFEGEQVYFCYTEFSGGNATFHDIDFAVRVTDFHGAKFTGGSTSFDSSSFESADAVFQNTIFSGGNSNFSNVNFGNTVNFSGAVSEAPINLIGSNFSRVPDFRLSKLSAHFSLHEMSVEFKTIPTKFLKIFPSTKANTSADADCFRRLKELAVQARDHEREQDFFAKELKAKRFYETTGLSLIPSYLYEWTSDFGRSLFRPIVCLVFTWLLFGLFYGVNGLQYATTALSPLWDGLKLSLATLVPFAAISRTAMTEARENLFGENVSLLMDAAMVFEGVLAITFIFLIGLALRNRFRI